MSAEQQRHKSLEPLDRPRELVIACPSLRSHVNLSRIVRLAGCCGVTHLITCGNTKIDTKIARDSIQQIKIERRRSLGSILKKLKTDGFRLVGLEQTAASEPIYQYRYQRRSVLVVGHERKGMTDEILHLIDDLVEIPVYGMPYSHNVATATTIAVYEYCRQFPRG